MDEKKSMVVFSQNIEDNSNNTLIIKKVGDDMLGDILFLRSMMPKLLQFSTLLKTNSWENLKYHTFLEISEMLKKLVTFLFGNDYLFDENIWEIVEVPNEIRQAFIKDFRFFEIFTDIIHISEIQLLKCDSLRGNDFWLHKNLEINHNILRYSIQEYRPNELYACQWITLILEQSIKEYKNHENYAGDTLTELINNNKAILESKIDSKTISMILDYLINGEKNSKYITILSALCICNGYPMIQNQKELTNKILKDKNVMEYFLFKVYQDEQGEVFVSNLRLGLQPKQLIDFCDFKDFNALQETSKDKSTNPRLFDYFLATIKFFADLCFERNNLALNILHRHYSFEIFLRIFQNPQISYKVKDAFCRLFINLSVEVFPYYKADFNMNVYKWDELEDKVMLPCSRYDISKFKEIKNYVLDFLKKETKINPLDIQHIKDKLSFLNTIVLLTMKMLTLGFYNDITEIEKLIFRMKNTLNRSFRQFDTLSIQLSKISKQNKTEYSGNFYNLALMNTADKGLVEVLRNCRVSICRFLEMVMNLDTLIKKFPTMFKIRNIVSSALKSEEFVPKSFREEYDNLSETRKEELREVINGNNEYLCSDNYDEFVDIIGDLISHTSKEDNLISHLRDDGFVQSLLALSFEDSSDIKKLSFRLIFKIFSNCFDLTRKLNDLILLQKESESLYNNLLSTNHKLVETLDYMISFRTMKNEQISLELAESLNKLIELVVHKRDYSGNDSEVLPEPERESLPLELAKPSQEIYPFQALLIKYSESSIEDQNKNILRGVGIVESLLELLSINTTIEANHDGLNEYTVSMIIFLLTLLIKDNEENQLLIMNRYQVVGEYFMGELINDNTYFLFAYLIKNNKNVLFEEDMSKRILGAFLLKEAQLSNNDIRKSYLFHIITLFCNYYGKAIRRNQNMIFNYFIKKGENSFYLRLREMRYVSLIQNYSTSYYDHRKNKVKGDTKYVILPAKLCTVMSIIQLINECNKGGNTFVMNISERIITFEKIKKLITERLPISLKIVFLKYMKRIYLDNIDELEEYEFKEYFMLFEDLQKTYINIDEANTIGKDKELTHYNIVTFSGCYRCSEWNSEFRLTIIKSMNHLFVRGLVNSKCNMISGNRQFEEFTKNLLDIICLAYDDSDLEFKQLALNFVTSLMTQTPLNFLRNIKTKYKDEINQILGTNPNIGRILTLQDEAELSKVEDITKNMIKRFKDSELFEHYCEEELKDLVNMILGTGAAKLEGKKLNFSIFVQSLTIYLNELSPKDVNCITEGLNILKKLLEFTRESETNNNDNLEKLMEVDIVKTLFKLFESGSLNIMDHCIQLLVELLLFGGKSSQNRILAMLSDDHGLFFFKSLKSNMEKSLIVIEDIMTQVNDNKLGFLLDQKIMLENVGRLGVEMEVDMIDSQMELIKRVFYLLQLIATRSDTGKSFMRFNIVSSFVSSESTSIISFSVGFFFRLCKLMNVGILDLGNSLLDFLLQAIDGPCQEGQNLVIQSKFLDCVKLVVGFHKDNMELVKRGFDEEEEKVEEFYTRLLLVTKGLIEGNKYAYDFIEGLKKVLTVRYLLGKIHRDLRRYFETEDVVPKLKSLQTSQNYDVEIETIFNIFFIVKMLYQSKSEVAQGIATLTPDLRDIYNYFDSHSGCVEIVLNDKIFVTHHLIHPIFTYLSDKYKKEILDAIDRDVPKKKMQDFVKIMPTVFDLISFKSQINKNLISSELFEKCEKLTFILCAFINLIMFAFFKKEITVSGDAITQHSFNESHPVLIVTTMLHLIMAGLKLMIWLLTIGRVEIMKEWRQIFEEVGKKMKFHDKYKEDESSLELTKQKITDLTFKQRIRLMEIHNEIMNLDVTWSIFDYYFYNLYFIIVTPKFKFLLFYLLCSFFAYKEKIFFFYCILLLDVVNYENTLQNVQKSITNNAIQLLLTALLGLTIIFLFVLAGYEWIWEDFYMSSIGDEQIGQNACSTILHCFFTITSFVSLK